MKDYYEITKCLLCGHPELSKILSLTPTPPANAFVKFKVSQTTIPLDVLQCQNCQHVQISCIVDYDLMYSDYVYVSGTSAVTRQHFQDYADTLIKNYNLDSNSFVVDVGSNDGTFLSNFKSHHIKVLGIDPAWQIANVANQQGITTWSQFFGLDVAKEIVQKYGHADVISCNNMFAHNGNLDGIVEGIYHLLKDDGVFVLEVSYLMDVLDTNGFDLIYHEHIHQWSLTPMIQYLKKFNLQVIDAECIDIQCGSLRVHISKETCNKYTVSSHVKEIIELEKVLPLKLSKFSDKIEKTKNELMGKLRQYKKEGCRIVGYGASAKSTTLLHHFDISSKLTTVLHQHDINDNSYILDAICDDSDWKIGKFTPGTCIPVVSPQYLYDKSPDFCVILSCNFADSIMKNHPDFKGTWIVPLPKYKEYPFKEIVK